ncbi:chondroitinase-B domain-containing protein [Pedobacter mucosus]|uniref:chondroitinase-B domain-containing protein n=1 Tax=Pedobacter mucosus TaxID=2895286 RepID=UPI001EE42933|nr:chondroitinase-B domain-containing protein [Pedobacter mucosus]UKT65450.1 hypothetical protein LOK61_06600 [Pedobacter mucosus]
MKKLFLIIFLFIKISTPIFAQKYLIHNEEEFKNLQEKLMPGDQITIANGNYTNWSTEIKAKGTKEKPIIIKAEHLDKVVFSGTTDHTIFKVSGDYVQLKGITFNGCMLVKADGKNGNLITMDGSKNSLISNCRFLNNIVKTQFTPLVIVSGNGQYNLIDSCLFGANVDNQDIQIKVTKESFPLYTTVKHCLFQNKTKVSWSNGNGGECIQVGQDPVLLGNQAPKSIITENRFIRCDAENEVISNKSSNNLYTKNYFENNDGELVMRGGHDCLISDNIFNGGTGGIRINGTGHILTENKISNIKTAIRLMYGMAKGKNEIGFYTAASNCIIKNNIINNATTGILIGDSKNADWTNKFDTKRYPSPVIQNIAPFDNEILNNVFSNVNVKSVIQ